MAVQIYQNEELNDLVFQESSLDEWKEIAGLLKLDGQLKFVNNSCSPLPYPYMNGAICRIFETLCPTKLEYNKYSKTPIPLEVLQQIKFSINDGHFQEIQIWYDDKKIDPVVVGVTCDYYAYDSSYNRMCNAEKKQINSNSKEELRTLAELSGFKIHTIAQDNINYYLIARWGDEKKELPELKKEAIERLMEKYGTELRVEIEEKSQALKKLQDNVIRFVNNEISENQLKGKAW